jgi:hypothetical protein
MAKLMPSSRANDSHRAVEQSAHIFGRHGEEETWKDLLLLIDVEAWMDLVARRCGALLLGLDGKFFFYRLHGEPMVE